MTTQSTLLQTQLFPLLDALDTHLNELYQHLMPYNNADLNKKPASQSWSALQVCYHLILSERTSLMYLQKKLSFKPKLRKAGMESKLRLTILKKYLNSPLKVKAPAAVADDHLPTESSLERAFAEWKQVRQDLRHFLSSLSDDVLECEIFKHPVAGKLNIDGMLQFFDEHFKRHHKQIKRTLRQVIMG